MPFGLQLSRLWCFCIWDQVTVSCGLPAHFFSTAHVIIKQDENGPFHIITNNKKTAFHFVQLCTYTTRHTQNQADHRLAFLITLWNAHLENTCRWCAYLTIMHTSKKRKQLRSAFQKLKYLHFLPRYLHILQIFLHNEIWLYSAIKIWQNSTTSF